MPPLEHWSIGWIAKRANYMGVIWNICDAIVSISYPQVRGQERGRLEHWSFGYPANAPKPYC